MRNSVTVCLGESAVEVGTLVFEHAGARQSVAFEYTSAWLASPNRFALSPDLPLIAGFQYRANKDPNQSAFFACFADVEPEGWGRTVIQRDYALQRKAAGASRAAPAALLNDFDYLLWVNDFSRMGAVRFRDQAGVFQRPPGGNRGTPPLIQLPHLVSASRAVEENTETARDLEYLRGNGTSLDGLRPKCSVLDDDGTLAIGKFPSVKDNRSIVHGEVLALTLATAAGINAAKARLVDSEGVPVAVITRFDREGVHRRMYLSARSLLEASPGERYTYIDIANALRKFGARAGEDLEELWRRMVFNILINNVDDHLNNHGFLHRANGQWELSPAFDLNPFPDKARSLKTWISEAGDEASLSEALAVAPLFGIKEDAGQRILSKVLTAVRDWRACAKQIGMSDADIEAFAPAFAHPEA